MDKLDRYDRAILEELQVNARLTNAELAQRVGLSAAPCWRRVRALEEAGVITGYRAVVDRSKVGLGVLAFVRLEADRIGDGAIDALERAIQALPQVLACHYTSGTGTFELQVVARDLDAFSRLAREQLSHLPNVKAMQTRFSLGEIAVGGVLPVGD
ncbi:MAG: Lrp/AsnC family transcriptional regulator [Comamonas sp.]